MSATASIKQVDLIFKLASERVAPTWVQNLLLVLKAGQADMKIASKAITDLFAAPKKAGSPTITATPGYYLLEGTVYVVVESKDNPGRLYAKGLVLHGTKGKWEFAKVTMGKLTPAMRLSLEDAKAFGRLHGCCCICGATLTDPKSVEAGIGPICAGKV